MRHLIVKWTGAVALALGLLTVAASAAPLTTTNRPNAPASVSVPEVQQVGWAERRAWRHHGGWDRGGRGWAHRGWRHDRPWRRNHFRGSGVYLGLGLGLPVYRDYGPRYYAGPRYYVKPHYYADEPVYRVRRGHSGHVGWCASRYRSYTAWNNTYQPYHGPRRQCRSPYRY